MQKFCIIYEWSKYNEIIYEKNQCLKILSSYELNVEVKSFSSQIKYSMWHNINYNESMYPSFYLI